MRGRTPTSFSSSAEMTPSRSSSRSPKMKSRLLSEILESPRAFLLTMRLLSKMVVPRHFAAKIEEASRIIPFMSLHKEICLR